MPPSSEYHSRGCDCVCVVLEPYHARGGGGGCSGRDCGCGGVESGVEYDVASKATAAVANEKEGCE